MLVGKQVTIRAPKYFTYGEKEAVSAEPSSEGSNLKALIVYATRYGATKGTAEEIARILQEENIEVKTVNAKEEKVNNISEYDLVVGSGMAMGNWCSEAMDFFK